MKDMEYTEHDVIDQMLHSALASDAVPSDDFTARLMEQVRCTPQERPRHMRPALKALAALAACAVIAVAIPLAMPGAGSAGPKNAAMADTSGSDAFNTYDGAAAQEQEMLTTSGAPAAGRMEKSGDTPETVTLTGADAQKAQSVLADMSLQPFDQEDSATVYELTAEEAAALGEQVDALYGIEGACTLILEDIK